MPQSAIPAQASWFSNPLFIRTLGWCNLAVMFVFLYNVFGTFWFQLPGPSLSGEPLAVVQALLYPIVIIATIYMVFLTRNTSLREDSFRISNMNAVFIRAAFWSVLLLGIVDAVISFLRVEDLLHLLVGEEMDKNIGRSRFRGPYIHGPLILLGIFLATRTKTLGFHWLTLLIVIAELLIVILRFIFSYEQAFMADLVRFWYGALFLFASAHTLLEEGHVRVDIAYAGMAEKTKGWVNAIGSLFMGIPLCWTIIYLGMGQKTSLIISPILNFETTQSGFGLYLKYMLAAFLGVFAISMMIQFVSYLMGAVADYRAEEGKYKPTTAGGH